MGYLIFLIIALLALGLAIVISFAFNASEDRDIQIGLRVGAGFLGFVTILITLVCSYSSIETGHVGLVYSFGSIKGQRSEGLQWTSPWQSVEEVSVQTAGHKFEKMTTFSKETQSVTITATVNARVDPAGVQELYRTVGKRYFEILIEPRVHQSFKDETVKYSSIEIAPSREIIRENVRNALAAEMLKYSIVIDDLLINDITFGDQFEKAIEEKQTQTQLALSEKEKVAGEKARADQKIEAARGEAESTLILATKQAEANKILSESLTPEYLQYQYVTKLAPNVRVMMVPAGQNLMLDAAAIDPVK